MNSLFNYAPNVVYCGAWLGWYLRRLAWVLYHNYYKIAFIEWLNIADKRFESNVLATKAFWTVDWITYESKFSRLLKLRDSRDLMFLTLYVLGVWCVCVRVYMCMQCSCNCVLLCLLSPVLNALSWLTFCRSSKQNIRIVYMHYISVIINSVLWLYICTTYP